VQTATIAVPYPLDPEDRARADCYAILAGLLVDAPDAAFLRALGAAPRLPEDGTAPLTAAYNRLLDASQAMDADAARQEYVDLFVGVGKSEVDPHAAHWRNEPGSNRTLAVLRRDLAELGLGRRPESSLYEDHVGALCETMRILIAGGEGRPPAPISIQQTFFEAHIGPWAQDFCNAILRSPLANYYRRVAEFGSLFVAIERDSFAIE
jgi:TorA maturation chaperone TorD